MDQEKRSIHRMGILKRLCMTLFLRRGLWRRGQAYFQADMCIPSPRRGAYARKSRYAGKPPRTDHRQQKAKNKI